KRVVHHWKKAGGPGQIPGYATHLEEVAKTARYLKYGGYVAIGLGATSSYLKVQEVCRAGESPRVSWRPFRLSQAATA
ncbi:PAAR domain-containing protein, partial [Pseudomonas guariconensis]|nr:PAAR domain-containing protein [Pseudomonas guariconensis]